MPSGITKKSLSPSVDGVTWTRQMPSRFNSAMRFLSVIGSRLSTCPRKTLPRQQPLPSPFGEGPGVRLSGACPMWSMSYIESPLGTASAFTLLPLGNIAWGVKTASRFFCSALKVSKSSRHISPRLTFSSASSIPAHTRAVCPLSTTWLKRASVHSRTLLLTDKAIPNAIVFSA